MRASQAADGLELEGVLEKLADLRKAQPHFGILDYDGMKTAVDSKDPDAALRRLQAELLKVNDVVTVQVEALSTELRKQLRKDVIEQEETLESLGQAIVQLDSYVSLSHEVLMGVVQRCREQEETASCAWFAARVEGATFRACDFDTLLAQLGQLYAAWRTHKRRGRRDEGEFKGAPGPARAFLLPRREAMSVKVSLLKSLAPAARQVRIPTTSTTRTAGKHSYDFQRKCSEVYFEGASGTQYAERFRRTVAVASSQSAPPAEQPPALLHCSWTHDCDRDTEVLLTAEDAEGRLSQSQLGHRDMSELLAGRLPDRGEATDPSQQAALSAALSTLQEHKLRPCVSVSFLRYSYVDTESHAEVASVDEELLFCDETAASNEAGQGWCRAAASRAPEERELSGAVLRLRLSEAAANALLADLGSSGMMPVPGFSVALHGTAVFHPELAVPPPPWLPSDSGPSTGSAYTHRLASSRDRRGFEDLAARAPPTRPASTKGNTGKRGRDWSGLKILLGWCVPKCCRPPVQLTVDVKTPLASERTAIRWLRSSVLMAGLSGLLMAGEDRASLLNGLLMGLAALLLVLLPTYQFWQRSREFRQPRPAQPRVDRFMPTTLAIMFSVLLSSTLVIDLSLHGVA